MASALNETEVDLSWTASTDNTGVTGYTIYRDGAQLATVDGSTTSYHDATVAASTGYSYTVDAYDGAGNHSAQSTAADVTTPAVPSSATIQPVADAWVYAFYPNNNYGSSTQLRLDGSPIIVSYLKFDVPALSGAITHATLRLYANSAQSTGYDVHAVSDTTWNPATMTYNNAPAYDAAIIGSSGPVAGSTWTEVDISSFVTSPGTISVALVTTSNTALSLASMEAGSTLAPQLVLSTS